MKIHSQWHGMLQLKEMPSEALQIEMREVLGDFIVSSAVSDNPDEKLINISGIGIYQSVRMEAMLKQLEPITTSGKIDFSNSEKSPFSAHRAISSRTPSASCRCNRKFRSPAIITTCVREVRSQ